MSVEPNMYNLELRGQVEGQIWLVHSISIRECAPPSFPLGCKSDWVKIAWLPGLDNKPLPSEWNSWVHPKPSLCKMKHSTLSSWSAYLCNDQLWMWQGSLLSLLPEGASWRSRQSDMRTPCLPGAVLSCDRHREIFLKLHMQQLLFRLVT